MKHLIRLAVLALIGLPLVAGAATQAELAAQAEALLQQVAALQAQLAAGGQTQTGFGTAAATPVNTTACPNIGRALKHGSSGDDVMRLQQFLALDASVYPEGLATGYYGSLTEAAVKRWQVKYNIVSSGTPATTGYGVVGPRTAAAIALLCATGGGAGGGTAGPVGGFIQVSPISGNTPLPVSVQATVNTTNSCGAASYTLNFGDGTAPQLIHVPAGTCKPLVQTHSHSYIYGGTYKITLSAGTHQTSATVVVYGPGAPVGIPNPGASSLPSQTFVVSPTSGASPLTVTFSGTVTGASAGWCAQGCSSRIAFGDGQTGLVQLPLTQTGVHQYSMQHTYTQGGTYTAIFYQGQTGSGQPTVGNPVTIQVSGNTTLPPFGLTPNIGGDPLKISVQFEYASCQGYTLTWGDGLTDSKPSACGSTTNTSTTLSHTYAQGGSYTVTLQRASQTDTASIVINN